MPLDTVPSTESQSVRRAAARVENNDPTLVGLRPVRPELIADGDVGAALRLARERMGLAIEDIAAATRVRAAYIAAIETFDFDRLPPRSFVVGYVRAYARALGLEPEAVALRFRAEAPVETQVTFAHPSRVEPPRRRLGGPLVAAALLVAAIIGWNVLRQVETAPQGIPPASVVHVAAASLPAGPARLGAPLPAPPEAATPPVYQTPGLSDESAVRDDGVKAGAPFVAGGTIYGAGGPGGLTLQARKPTSLIVRTTGGQIVFARQLAAGEAWRSPTSAGLVADVGNPSSIEVFVDGFAKGPLPSAVTSLSSLGG